MRRRAIPERQRIHALGRKSGTVALTTRPAEAEIGLGRKDCWMFIGSGLSRSGPTSLGIGVSLEAAFGLSVRVAL